jgi:hypothetical protein
MPDKAGNFIHPPLDENRQAILQETKKTGSTILRRLLQLAMLMEPHSFHRQFCEFCENQSF